MTLDKRKKLCRALAVEDGSIVAVGDDEEVRRSVPRGCNRIDLGGRVVVPGFIDCHTHFLQMGIDSMNVDLTQARTVEEALSLMKDASKKAPAGEWVIGAGWKESGWSAPRFITREDLDSSCPGNPAVAHRVCGHMSSVNTKAIEELGITSKTPDVEVNASGKLTGVLKESAVAIARRATAPDKTRKSKALTVATRKAHALGVTSIHDNGESEDFAIYRIAERAGKLGVRVWFNIPSKNIDAVMRASLVTGLGSERLKFGGLKVFCDGALGARTAAVSEPYVDDPGNKGMLVHESKDLESIVETANSSDVQLAIHAIGDVGIEAAIKAIIKALRKHPRRDARHRIEHLELPTQRHLKEMRRFGMIASMQPNFVGEWGGADGMYYARLGEGRARRNNPFKEVNALGVRLVFGSDCMPFSPLYGIHSVVNAHHPAQILSPAEAVAAYTRDAAYASFEEAFKGTISIGRVADFAVLSGDLISEPERIGDMSVLKTVVGGRIVYERRRRGRS